jgi:hypothetical protein
MIAAIPPAHTPRSAKGHAAIADIADLKEQAE